MQWSNLEFIRPWIIRTIPLSTWVVTFDVQSFRKHFILQKLLEVPETILDLSEPPLKKKGKGKEKKNNTAHLFLKGESEIPLRTG